MEDDPNFKAVLLRLFNLKNLKTNGFDTIEIDLVSFYFNLKNNGHTPNLKMLKLILRSLLLLVLYAQLWSICTGSSLLSPGWE